MTFHNLPLGLIRVNLDVNKVFLAESLPKPPSHLIASLKSNLKTAVNLKVECQNDPIVQAVDQAFNVIPIDPDEVPEFDYRKVRKAIVQFMGSILYGYEKFIVYFI